jgi:hypothetical protein
LSQPAVAVLRFHCAQFYATGETPVIGDIVSDEYENTGVVTRIMYWGSEHAELVIERDNGVIAIRYTMPEDFELIARREREEIIPTITTTANKQDQQD